MVVVVVVASSAAAAEAEALDLRQRLTQKAASIISSLLLRHRSLALAYCLCDLALCLAPSAYTHSAL